MLCKEQYRKKHMPVAEHSAVFYTYRLKVEMLIYEDKKHEIDQLFLAQRQMVAIREQMLSM